MRILLTALSLCVGIVSTVAGPLAAQQPPSNPQPLPDPRPLRIPYTEAQLRRAMTPTNYDLPDLRHDPGLIPPDATAGLFTQRVRFDEVDHKLAARQFEWRSSGLFHRPLYFEDVMLERHGHARHPLVQPWASGTRFFLTFPILAYKMQLDPVHKEISALGHYRPGSPAPHVLQRPRFRWDAAVVEAGVMTGLIFLVP